MSDSIEKLLRGTTAIVSKEELEKRIQSGKPLRVKLGVDPTAQHVTLGWAVVFRKLRDFQKLGHEACLIIGDFTAQIGDPTGKSKTRPQLTQEQVNEYTESVLKQIFKILDPEKTQVYRNSEWLGKMSFKDFIHLSSKITVARILERDDFSKRLEESKPLALHEIFYPLCQAYDSVEIRADIEIGGNDQLFNNLLGRTLMGQYEQTPQMVMTCPLLIGTDGKEKMSQSLGNYIGITESPNEMFGKTMSIPDHLIINWLELATDVEPEEIEQFRSEMDKGNLNPRNVKIRLAKEIIALYHNAEAAEAAEQYFIQAFQKKEVPTDIPEKALDQNWFIDGKIRLTQLIVLLEGAKSSGDAKRLMQSGAITVNGEKIIDITQEWTITELDQAILKIGKHTFYKLSLK